MLKLNPFFHRRTNFDMDGATIDEPKPREFAFTATADQASRMVYIVFSEQVTWVRLDVLRTRQLIELLNGELKELEKTLQ